MIRYRKSNRVRDLVGAIFFALAAALLWSESSAATQHAEAGITSGAVTHEVAAIRSADGLLMDRL